MHSFDSLSLKNFLRLNYNFLKNASVQKVQQPSRREIILSLRSDGESRKLYININPKYPHICFISPETFQMRALEIPKSPPMFCMQLRKYIEGARIKELLIPDYERILELHFEVYDEIGQLANLCLALEIMGKHSNVILYDLRSKNILGTAHNISPEKSSVREVYGGIPYIYPPKQVKTDILRTSFGAFYEVLKNAVALQIRPKSALCAHYYMLSEPLAEIIINKSKDEAEMFSKLQSTLSLNETSALCELWGGEDFNKALDDYFANVMFKDILEGKKVLFSRILNSEIKKLKNILSNPPEGEKAQKYKQKGDKIFEYIYLIKDGDSVLVTPDGDEIALDATLGASQNAQNYYKLYSKAKGAFEYQKQKYDEAKIKKDYYEGILFSVKNATDFGETAQIEQELAELKLIKSDGISKQKQDKINIIKTEFEGYEILLGKNNKQNDYLVSKIAAPNDIWLHAYNCPSSHVLVRTKNDGSMPPPKVLEYAAQLVKDNSPAKNSGKTSIIYTKRKDLKKPPGGVLGYVIYKNEKEIVI